MNPCNSCCYSGWVTGEVKFLRNRSGVVYQARFTVKVKRERKNADGQLEYDYIPIRVYGANRMKIVERIRRNDAVMIGGQTRTEHTKDSVNMYVNVETIQFSPKSTNNCPAPIAEGQWKHPQFNLPF